MKLFWVAIALILFSTSGGLAQSRCFGATHGVDDPKADTGYQRKYDTLAHRLLDDEKPTGQVTPQMYALLDSLIDQARAALKPYPAGLDAKGSIAYGRAALNTINCVLLANGFVWKDTEVMLLSDALRATHHGEYEDILTHDPKKNEYIKGRQSRDYHFVDCDTGSYIYMAIAETMRLPLNFVTVPGHAFVRWTADPENRFDFETTTSTSWSATGDIDQYYVKYFEIGEVDKSRRHALAGMSREQMVAFHHVFVAQALRAAQADKAAPDFSGMVKEYEAAMRFDPELDWPYNELAWYYAVIKPGETFNPLALQYALRGKVDEPVSRDTLACVYAALGDFGEASETEVRADDPLDKVDEFGRRTITKDTDDIAHHRRCKQTLKDYTATDTR